MHRATSVPRSAVRLLFDSLYRFTPNYLLNLTSVAPYTYWVMTFEAITLTQKANLISTSRNSLETYHSRLEILELQLPAFFQYGLPCCVRFRLTFSNDSFLIIVLLISIAIIKVLCVSQTNNMIMLVIYLI